jgi:hypothetical protein
LGSETRKFGGLLKRIRGRKLEWLDIAICYDSGLITDPKTAPIHLISAILAVSPIIPSFGKILATNMKYKRGGLAMPP